MKYQLICREDMDAVAAFSRFVRRHENCHFLQDPAWSDVKPLWTWHGICVYDEENIQTGAMSVLTRKLPAGLSIAYAPRGPVCFREDEEVMHTLMLGLRELARKYRCLLTYLDPDEPESNELFKGIMNSLGFEERHSDAFGGVQPQSVFRLSLSGQQEEALLAGFAPKTRYNIRLSIRRGVTVTKYPGGSPIPSEALDAFDELMITTGERDRFLVRNRAYFERLLSSLGNDAVLYLAKLDGKTIAGTLGIFYGDKAWYLYGASANEHRGAMPNYLLQWSMICDALRRGCTLYDFRGVPGTGKPDDPLYGLYRFKKGFSGEHTRFTGLYLYYHKPILGRLFDTAQNFFRKRRKNRKASLSKTSM